MTEPFQILFRGFWPEGRVRVHYRPQLTAWPQELEKASSAYWSRLQSKNPHLFNGELATLLAYRRSSTGILSLTLGRATYARLMYSNRMAEKWRFRQQQDRLVRVLGISAIVVTADSRIVVVKRSDRVGEYPGHWDVPGGHIHPPGSGAPEIFAAIEEELQGEIGLTPADLAAKAVIGLAENRANAKPELVFRVEATCDLSDIRRRWHRAPEREEFTAVEGIAADAKGVAAFIKDHAHETSPSALASLIVFAGDASLASG